MQYVHRYLHKVDQVCTSCHFAIYKFDVGSNTKPIRVWVMIKGGLPSRVPLPSTTNLISFALQRLDAEGLSAQEAGSLRDDNHPGVSHRSQACEVDRSSQSSRFQVLYRCCGHLAFELGSTWWRLLSLCRVTATDTAIGNVDSPYHRPRSEEPSMLMANPQ